MKAVSKDAFLGTESIEYRAAMTVCYPPLASTEMNVLSLVVESQPLPSQHVSECGYRSVW